MMYAAQQPSAGRLILQVVDAFPRRLRAGAIACPENKPGHNLHEEAKRERTAPNVPPPRSTGNVFEKCCVHHAADARSMVQPIDELAHQTGILSAMPARNASYRTQTSLPPSSPTTFTLSG